MEARGDGVRVSVILYDGESGAEIQRESLDASAADPFGLQDERNAGNRPGSVR